MVIEKVHGLHATVMSLNDRFTLLAAAAPDRVAARPRRRPSVNSYFNQNLNFKNRNLVDQIARRLEFEAKRQSLRQRLGTLRRFGSESSLPGLRRANSYGNLSQGSVKQRIAWRRNGNFSRSASFENLPQAWRGFRRRGGGMRALRGRFRGRGFAMGGRRALQQRPAGLAGRGRGRARGQGRGRGRGAQGPGRGRGGILKNQTQKPVPTKEELDDQLDRYMAGTKSALDKELDTYMKNAMDFE